MRLAPEFLETIAAIAGRERTRLDAPLAPFTTFRVGGPADCLVEAPDADAIARLVRAARDADVPFTMLGGGSNVVVADAGVRGMLVRAHGGRIVEDAAAGGQWPDGRVRVLVRADAGVTMNALVRWTIGRGFAGLEAWAGTPGTVGGAVFGNAHYGGHNIAEFIVSVRFLGAEAVAAELAADRLDFSYDHSRFQDAGETILSALFVLRRGGDPARLRETARSSLAYRKETQPLHMPSAGCVFQNPDPARDHVPDGTPASAGALVDRAGLKGHAVGGARVSPTHANFIVNEGHATASDIRALVRLCQSEVRRQFGVELREEILWIGDFGD